MTFRNRAPLEPSVSASEQRSFKYHLLEWCLEKARRSLSQGKTNEALQWSHLGARGVSGTTAPLVARELEEVLVEIAAHLPPVTYTSKVTPSTPMRWLHVIDGALPYGGHTAMAARWIALESTRAVSNVVLPDQVSPVPKSLCDAVAGSGGEIFVPESHLSLLDRAEWLRTIAYTHADVVVLHTHTHNVTASAAFGVRGGPPVVIVNHAAHVFWTGSAVADLVLNCRGSDLERFWTEEYRALPRCATLPIPLEEAGPFTADERVQARTSLGLPDHAMVLLTVGDSFKYAPASGLDFVATALSIVATCENTYLLVVGPEISERWVRAREESGGRIRPVGRQSNLSEYHAAADVYLEGFPFGSTTALLEAGARSLPCVLAPAQCPPPFGTDGVAVDGELERPADVAEYVAQVKELLQDSGLRKRRGESLSRSIAMHHTGDGWREYLDEIASRLPRQHKVYKVGAPALPPAQLVKYWAELVKRSDASRLFELFSIAIEWGLDPRLELTLLRWYRKAGLLGRGGRAQGVALLMYTLMVPFIAVSKRIALYNSIIGLVVTRRWMAKLSSRHRAAYIIGHAPLTSSQ